MTKIIAEIASCHNGDIELAKALVKAAKDCGVDIVKFQSWKADYVNPNDPDKERYKKYEFTDEMHKYIKDYCDHLGIEFLTTCTQIERIPFLKELGLKKIKIASVSLSNEELLKAAVKNFEEVIASTATQEKNTILTASLILRPTDTLMLCTANYPCILEDVNFKKLEWLQDIHASAGFSDHTFGIEAPIIAMSKGITYLEKHFTLSKYLPQIPHQMYPEGPYITTHEVANEPEVFKKIYEWRNIIERAHQESSVESRRIESLIRERYSGRY